jgi:CheY-like chemotaxis protein
MYTSALDALTPKPPPKVLVVDDNALIAWSVAEVLKDLGFETTTAGSGEEAMVLLWQTGYDAVVTDIHLPAADGFAVVATARGRNPRVPIVMMSAFADTETRRRAMLLGIEAFLDKPFDFSNLEQLAAQILAGNNSIDRSNSGSCCSC